MYKGQLCCTNCSSVVLHLLTFNSVPLLTAVVLFQIDPEGRWVVNVLVQRGGLVCGPACVTGTL